MEPPTIETQQPARQIRTRNEYYRGDLDCPPQYLVLQCTNSHTHHAPRGRHDARRGCGQHFVNYTAKHWGHKADWQSTCPNCGRKQRRNRGHVRPESVFDTRAEAWVTANRTNDRRAARQALVRIVADHRAGEPLSREYLHVLYWHYWCGPEWNEEKWGPFDEKLEVFYQSFFNGERELDDGFLEGHCLEFGVDF